MTVTEGMDTARARVVAGLLKNQGALLAGLGARGTVLTEVLQDVWGGPDAERFAREWQGARPMMARSSQELTAFADELTREADEQDRTSGADHAGGAPGEGAGAGSGRLPHVGGRVPDLGKPVIPVVPLADPREAGATWRTITEALGDLWDFYTDPLFGLVEGVVTGVVDVVDWVVEKLDLEKFKLLGKVGKVLGVLGGVASIAFGHVDMAEAVWRFITEGPSWDAALQFIEGWTGYASGALGIVALVAAGTVAGLPAALVVGAGAVVLGGISITIGLVREYGPWFLDVVEEDPAWVAKVSRHGGLRHGWELPERNNPIPPIYRASDRRGFMGALAGA